MSQYTEDENGNWILSEPGTGQEYDPDEHLANLISRVKNWNKEHVRDLLYILDQIPDVLRESGRPPRTSDVIDYSDLPSEPIPDGLEVYPIWAMDKSGKCLVGDTADEIESIEEIESWFDRNPSHPHAITAIGYESIEKPAKKNGNSSAITVPVSWLGHRVLCIRLD